MIIVDSSVIVKWIKRDEVDSDKARLIYIQHQKAREKIAIFQFTFIEISNYLATKSQTSEGVIKKVLDYLFHINLEILQVKEDELVETTILAKKYKTSVYDMLYAVVAKSHDTVLVTADKKFVEATKFSFVKLLSEYLS